MIEIGGYEIPEDEIMFNYARSSGPGGQNVNKVESKAVLSWNLRASESVPSFVKKRLEALYPSRVSGDGTLVIQSERYRKQSQNREDCLTKLGEMLHHAQYVQKKRIKTQPSRASKERRLQEKKIRSDRKNLRRKEFCD